MCLMQRRWKEDRGRDQLEGEKKAGGQGRVRKRSERKKEGRKSVGDGCAKERELGERSRHDAISTCAVARCFELAGRARNQLD